LYSIAGGLRNTTPKGTGGRTWTDDELRRIGDTSELQLASGRGETPHRSSDQECAMSEVVVIGAGSIGQAIARRVGEGKHVVLAACARGTPTPRPR
jgi:lactate dehydrogenase-like 2-hydroxyacid dehydrogenase